jgi:hypothetical protein
LQYVQDKQGLNCYGNLKKNFHSGYSIFPDTRHILSGSFRISFMDALDLDINRMSIIAGLCSGAAMARENSSLVEIKLSFAQNFPMSFP